MNKKLNLINDATSSTSNWSEFIFIAHYVAKYTSNKALGHFPTSSNTTFFKYSNICYDMPIRNVMTMHSTMEH